MRLAHQAGRAQLSPAAQRLAWAAAGSLALSVGLMAGLGLSGPSAAVPKSGSASPWPPYFTPAHLSEVAATGLAWLAVGLGGLGLLLGLVAARGGWRPRPGYLIAGCVLAVIALVLVPPLGSTDMLSYAIYGRIAALGHNPYLMTPAQLKASGDPVGQFSPYAWRHTPSVYGPLATLFERMASALGGASAAKTIFWLKVWNGLAFLAVTVALDVLWRSDAAARTRAHLLWSVNPLMLWAVLGGGHLDALPAAAGFLGLLCLRRLGAFRGVAAGLLIGAAIAIKAPFAFFLVGAFVAARRSPRTLVAITVAVVAAVLPGYLLTGRAAISALVSRATGSPDVYQPWQLLTRALDMHHTSAFTDPAGLAAFVVLTPVLLWGLPRGSSHPAGLRFAWPVLAVSLAWLICSPQQRPWYDAMILPVLAAVPATRLDWIVALRAMAAAMAELPGVRFYTELKPRWLSILVHLTAQEVVPAALVLVAGALIWLCVTGRWLPGCGQARPVTNRPSPACPPPSRCASGLTGHQDR